MLVTATGDDPEGDRVAEVLAAGGTPARQIKLRGMQTVTRLRFFAGDAGPGRFRLVLRTDKDPDSDLSHLRAEEEVCTPTFLDWWEQEAERSDAILFSDTDKGFLSHRVLAALNERTLRASARRVERGERPLLVIVDPKRAWEKYIGLKVDVFKPNDTEAAGAVGLPRRDWSVDVNLELLARRITERYGRHFPRIVITLGEHGAAMVVAGDPGPGILRYPGVSARTPWAGIAMHCGDMFASALALALCVDSDPAAAIPFANYVASLQVSKPVGQKITAGDLSDPLNRDHFRSSCQPPRQLA
jgi:bifunctional ADP-heptose synthase (sugar kinase/adenylyltransferase)